MLTIYSKETSASSSYSHLVVHSLKVSSWIREKWVMWVSESQCCVTLVKGSIDLSFKWIEMNMPQQNVQIDIFNGQWKTPKWKLIWQIITNQKFCAILLQHIILTRILLSSCSRKFSIICFTHLIHFESLSSFYHFSIHFGPSWSFWRILPTLSNVVVPLSQSHINPTLYDKITT